MIEAGHPARSRALETPGTLRAGATLRETAITMLSKPRTLTVMLCVLTTLSTITCAVLGPPYVVNANPPSCAAVVEQATRNPADSAIQPAKAAEIFIPPLPPPPALRGHTVIIHMQVTERGLVKAGSVHVDSVNATNYRHQVEILAEKTRFRPAQLSRCWVPSTAEIRYTFGR